jgi:hypothetical protein
MELLSRGVTIDLETVVQAYRKRLPRIEFLGGRVCPAIRQHTFQGLADRQNNA